MSSNLFHFIFLLIFFKQQLCVPIHSIDKFDFYWLKPNTMNCLTASHSNRLYTNIINSTLPILSEELVSYCKVTILVSIHSQLSPTTPSNHLYLIYFLLYFLSTARSAMLALSFNFPHRKCRTFTFNAFRIRRPPLCHSFDLPNDI